MKKVNTNKAPGAIGPYSQAMISNNLVFISGQLPIDASTGEMPEDVVEQAKVSLNNLKAIVEESGSELAKVVKTTVYLKDINDFTAVNEVYATYFKEPYPARVAFQVGCLPKDAKVEVEAIAEL